MTSNASPPACQLDACKRYTVLKLLGRGSFGEVHRALDTETGQYVALKRIFIRDPGPSLPNNILRELQSLELADHDNVIRLLDTIVEGQSLVLVQELCATDVHSLLHAACGPLPPSVVKRFMRDLLRGVEHLHSCGITHRDLKPSNLLLDAAGSIKIADFGLSRPMLPRGRRYSFTVPSRQYRAPELLFGCKDYDARAVDMWSVGCVFAAMLGKSALFDADSELQQLRAIMQLLGTYSPADWGQAHLLPDYGKIQFPAMPSKPLSSALPDAPASALELLENLLRYNPEERWTATECLASKYFFEQPACACDQAVQNVMVSS